MPRVSAPVSLVWDVIGRLDAMDHEVTDWEASFLASLLEKRERFSTPTPKQLHVLCRMAEQYLPDGVQVAAELRGQQRLL